MSSIRVVLLFGLLIGIFLAIGFYFAGIFGAITGLVIATFLNIIMYWFSDKWVLAMYKAKPCDDKEIKSIIKGLSDKAKIPVPALYIIDTDMPNAFATGRSPKRSAVAVTRGLVEKLNKSELKGVLAHEISHIKNRDTLVSVVAATLAGAISWIGYVFMFDDDRNIVGSILIFILAPIAAMLIQMAISRSREFGADKTGADLSNPFDLASALEKISEAPKIKASNPSAAHLFIVNPFSGGAVLELFSTHPRIEERIRRLNNMKVKF